MGNNKEVTNRKSMYKINDHSGLKAINIGNKLVKTSQVINRNANWIGDINGNQWH